MNLSESYKSRLKELAGIKSLLSEGMTDIVYHFTYLTHLLNIIKQNQFQASTNIGSKSDLQTSKGKFFFFSTTRSKSIGFTKGNIKLVLNGKKLSQNYKVAPIDYWQYSTKPEDWGDVKNDPQARASYMLSLKSKELEDRIFLDKPTIDNAIQYILGVHILLNDGNIQHATKKEIEYLLNFSKEKNIPFYFYTEEKNFLNQVNSVSNPLSLEGFGEEKEKYKEMDPFYRLDRVFALLCYKSEENFNKVLKTFGKENDEKFISKLKERIQKDGYTYLDHPSSFDMHEYNSVIGADVHNARSNADPVIRTAFKMLADDMKKWNAKSLSDYIQYKSGYKKQEPVTNTKTKYVLWDTQGKFEVPWNKTAWFYLDQEEVWKLLPGNIKNDAKFVELINKKDAKMDYVYNFLVKNINKVTADKIFKTAYLEVRKEQA